MNKLKRKYLSWGVVATLISLLIFVPLLFVLDGFLEIQHENVKHIREHLLTNLFLTTGRMILGVGLVAFLLGVPAAYFTANYNFPLRRVLLKANVLPVAVPTYIMAFTYASIFSITGSFYKIAELFVSRETLYTWNIDVLTEGWLMLFLGFALYPYVYTTTLVALTIKNKSIDEAAASLGAKTWKRFWSVSFPIILPAILGGLALVAMEVVNDYGAMSYFNVNTLTAGIFQAKQMDMQSSLYIAALVFVVILGFFTMYYLVKSYRRINHASTAINYDLIPTKGSRSMLISLVVFIPFFLGFLLPVSELIYLASSRMQVVFSADFFIIATNSIQLAFIPAVIIVFLSLLLRYNQYLNEGFISRFLTAVANIGYGIPGAIIAVAVMSFVMSFDNEAKTTYHFMIDGLFLLIFAYVIRFMAVGYNTIESGFNQLSKNLPDASRSTGKGALHTLIFVYLPLLKGTLLTALAIVTVDILKELPITLLLQRFNFDTLATVAYEKAKVTESVRDAAPYALLLIFVGTLAVLLLVGRQQHKVK